MKKIIPFLFIVLLSKSITATERYVYKANVLLALNAKLVIDVDSTVINNEKVLFVKTNSRVSAFGSEIANIDYLAYNDILTFEPKINIECEHSSKQPSKNCRGIKFLPMGQFLYKKYHNNVTELKDIELGEENVELQEISTQQPTYNPNEHKIYDIASIALLIRYLNIDKDHRDMELFIAVNESIAKVRVSYVEDIDSSKIWLKLTPIHPAPEDFSLSFPDKIVYDTKLKVVTEIHQKLPVVGDTVIKLDRKESRF